MARKTKATDQGEASLIAWDDHEGDAREADLAFDDDAAARALDQLDLDDGEDEDGAPVDPDHQPAQGRMRIVPLDVVTRFRPFDRHPQRRGLGILPLLRRQLLRDPIETIDGVAQRIAQCIAMQAAVSDEARALRVAYALQARFGAQLVQPAIVQTLIQLRNFAAARATAVEYVSHNRGDYAAQALAAQTVMIAGVAGAAQLRYRKLLNMAIKHQQDAAIPQIVHILIEGGDIDWLRQHYPAQTEDFWAARVEARLGPQIDQIPIFCISLDQDAARFQSTAALMQPAGTIERIPGVKGAYLPDSFCDRWMADDLTRLSPGEIGCHLSHMAAWERIAARLDDDDHALVTEDDARFLYGPGRGLSEVLAGARKAKADLVFVNLRACLGASREYPWDHGPARVLPIHHRYRRNWPVLNPGWGTDGYVVTGRGARLLLEAWKAVGLAGSIDWQMKLMSHRSLPDALRTSHTAATHDALTRRGTWPVLPGFTTNLPIIHTRDFGFSAINAG